MEDKILKVMKEVFDTEALDTTCSQDTCDNWDSLHHLMLISELEEAFDVEFEPEEMAAMKDFTKVKATLQSKL